MSSGAPLPDDDRSSHMFIDFTLSIGYRRRRPESRDVWEMRIDSFALIIIGSIVVVLILIFLVPHILEWVAHLGQVQ